LGNSVCQKPSRLLSGTTSVLIDSLDDALENPGVIPLPRKVEIWKLKHTLLDVYYGYSFSQQPSRLLSGTTCVLLLSLNDALENPGVRRLSRKVEIWKLIHTFLDVYYGYSYCQKSSRLLSGITCILLDSLDDSL
jgi:hypothetical protein